MWVVSSAGARHRPFVSIGRPTKRTTLSASSLHHGLGQLTLVEHALCPLSQRDLCERPLSYQSCFQFPLPDGKRGTATATVAAAFGLQPKDEFFLWGLLALTFASQEPSPELHASPYAILKSLGCINESSDRGGSAFRTFRRSLRRLAGVTYQCDNFYDSSCREHRQVAFSLLSYSLPIDATSPRTWRIIWDPLFFELCVHSGGTLSFDIDVYRSLDAASRRLYLFLAKILWRREWTHWLDVYSLATNVLGFLPSIAMRNLKQKVKRAVSRLIEKGAVSDSGDDLFARRPDGTWAIRLRRGSGFKPAARRSVLRPVSQELAEPLQKIGLDEAAISSVVKRFDAATIQQWAEITLAAKESRGLGFFKKSPQAYFIDNLRQAAEGRRTPPDWWWNLKREQEQRIESPAASRLARSVLAPQSPGRSVSAYLKTPVGQAEFRRLFQPLYDELCKNGKSQREAQRLATEHCISHLQRRLASSKE